MEIAKRDDGRSLGYGWVQFDIPQTAIVACGVIDGSMFHDRIVKARYHAGPRNPRNPIYAVRPPTATSMPVTRSSIPEITILRVCLLGGGTFKHTDIDKLDVASALICGLTSCAPLGPRLAFAYDEGVFKLAWKRLFDGLRPHFRSAWQNLVEFDVPEVGNFTPIYEGDPTVNSASMCAGSDRLDMGGRDARGITSAFQTVLRQCGHDDLGQFAMVHRDLLAEAKCNPSALVQKLHPAPHLEAAFAHFAPVEAGTAINNTVFVDVFEVGYQPCGSLKNVALVYATAPSRFTKHTKRTFLNVIQGIGANVHNTVCKYNALATNVLAPQSAPNNRTSTCTRSRHADKFGSCVGLVETHEHNPSGSSRAWVDDSRRKGTGRKGDTRYSVVKGGKGRCSETSKGISDWPS